jgi:hypothetical protein
VAPEVGGDREARGQRRAEEVAADAAGQDEGPRRQRARVIRHLAGQGGPGRVSCSFSAVDTGSSDRHAAGHSPESTRGETVPPEAASAFVRAARHAWRLRELTLDGPGESREVMTPCDDAVPLTASCRKAPTRARTSQSGAGRLALFGIRCAWSLAGVTHASRGPWGSLSGGAAGRSHRHGGAGTGDPPRVREGGPLVVGSGDEERLEVAQGAGGDVDKQPRHHRPERQASEKGQSRRRGWRLSLSRQVASIGKAGRRGTPRPSPDPRWYREGRRAPLRKAPLKPGRTAGAAVAGAGETLNRETAACRGPLSRSRGGEGRGSVRELPLCPSPRR